jgi:hypothetical protein
VLLTSGGSVTLAQLIRKRWEKKSGPRQEQEGMPMKCQNQTNVDFQALPAAEQLPATVSQEEALVDYLEALEEGRLDVVRDLLDCYPGLAQQAQAFQADEAQLDRLFAPLSPTMANRELLLPAGTRVNDYEILEHLASGGMGVVYRARQSRPEREVALKMVRRDMKGPLEGVPGRT